MILGCSQEIVNTNVSNLRVLGRMKEREIYVLVVMGTSVAQLVRAPDRRTGDLQFKSRLRKKIFS